MNINYTSWISEILIILEEASQGILSFDPSKPLQVQPKADQSPVTAADLYSHRIIEAGLQTLDGSIPIISEEGESIPYEERKHWKYFWLVDPLDGTREFIRGSEEYSINIALIAQGSPVLGMVAVPKLNHYYWALTGGPAYKRDKQGHTSVIHTNQHIQTLKIASSRYYKYPNNLPMQDRKIDLANQKPEILDEDRHSQKSHEGILEWQNLLRKLDKFKKYELHYFGSALKICLVAEGLFDLYPRFGHTGEWDTAAGQCILEAAGGKMVDLAGQNLQYNKPDFLNPSFLAVGDVDLLSYIVDKSK